MSLPLIRLWWLEQHVPSNDLNTLWAGAGLTNADVWTRSWWIGHAICKNNNKDISIKAYSKLYVYVLTKNTQVAGEVCRK